MKILITGGAGFIGRWLLRVLPPEHEVVVVDALEPQVHGADADFPEDVRRRATCVLCRVQDVDRWIAAAAGVDVVVHLAALTGTAQSMQEQRRYIDYNVTATAGLLDGLATVPAPPRRVVLASSRAVYGEGAFLRGTRRVYPGPRRDDDLRAGRWAITDDQGAPLVPAPTPEEAPLEPASTYGLTKVWQEQLFTQFARRTGADFLILRLQNVYGPLQSLSNPYTGILGQFATDLYRRGRVELFEDGKMTRDFVAVSDVARVLMGGLAYQGELRRTLNVGSGRATSLGELVDTLATAAERACVIDCRGRYRPGDIRHAVADMSRYEEVFGPWRPRSLEDGMREYLEWFTNQPGAIVGVGRDTLLPPAASARWP